jgi:NTE family protein
MCFYKLSFANSKNPNMKGKFLTALLFIIIGAGITYSYGQGTATIPIKKYNRMLISSGGGARGAWGVGLVEALLQKHPGGYDAVFGTSTGSLMAPYILLSNLDRGYLKRLEHIYTSVNQKSIFNVNPFNTDTSNGVVTSTPRIGAVIHALICGKKTFGESKKLRKLIHDNLNQAQIDSIRNGGFYLGVGVCNMVTGTEEIVSNQQVASADSMDNWIWASANEPLWMSYYHVVSPNSGKKGWFVDGGLRDVIPIMQGIAYAIEHNIDTIDVIVNNGKQTIDDNWNPNEKGMKALLGLERILDVYGAGTMAKDTMLGHLLTDLHNCEVNCPSCKPSEEGIDVQSAANAGTSSSEGTTYISIYFMDSTSAAKYRDELAFYPSFMAELLTKGQNYFVDNPKEENVVHLKVSHRRFRHAYPHLFKKDKPR